MPATVPMTVEQLEELASHCYKVGTIEHWMVIAMQWMKQADTEIHKLRQENERLKQENYELGYRLSPHTDGR